jgi:hypothetical protein
MKLPPLSFLVFKDQQPDLKTLQLFETFISKWNNNHEAKFKQEGQYGDADFTVWELVLPDGGRDKELSLITKEMNLFREKHGLVWVAAIDDIRSDAHLEQCPFIKFVSDGYDDDFYVNADEIFTPSTPCDHCGNTAPYSDQIVGAPVIDESFLDEDNDVNELYGEEGLDFINLPYGGFFVSPRVKQVLESLKVTGYELLPVISKTTRKPSDRLFLLKATKTIVDPCHEHTPREKNAICPHCGARSNTVTGYFHVSDQQLNNDEIFSINRFGCSAIYFSQRIFMAFKKEKINKMTVSAGIEKCSHL